MSIEKDEEFLRKQRSVLDTIEALVGNDEKQLSRRARSIIKLRNAANRSVKKRASHLAGLEDKGALRLAESEAEDQRLLESAAYEKVEEELAALRRDYRDIVLKKIKLDVDELRDELGQLKLSIEALRACIDIQQRGLHKRGSADG